MVALSIRGRFRLNDLSARVAESWLKWRFASPQTYHITIQGVVNLA